MKHYSELHSATIPVYYYDVLADIERISKLSSKKAIHNFWYLAEFFYPTLHRLPLIDQERLEEKFRTAFINAGGWPYTIPGQKSDIAKLYQTWYVGFCKEKLKVA